MISGLIGIHYAWFYLQQNERIVPKEEQLTEQPIVTVGFKRTKYAVWPWKSVFLFLFHCFLRFRLQASRKLYRFVKEKAESVISK